MVTVIPKMRESPLLEHQPQQILKLQKNRRRASAPPARLTFSSSSLFMLNNSLRPVRHLDVVHPEGDHRLHRPLGAGLAPAVHEQFGLRRPASAKDWPAPELPPGRAALPVPCDRLTGKRMIPFQTNQVDNRGRQIALSSRPPRPSDPPVIPSYPRSITAPARAAGTNCTRGRTSRDRPDARRDR